MQDKSHTEEKVVKSDNKYIFKILGRDLPGGPMVKNPPSNAGDAGSIPGWGTKIPHTVGQLRPCALEPVSQN